jgi:serine/threonine-protein kinase PpkA
MEIKGYKIEGQIGQGGMAIVYRAIQESLDRPVALKVMNPLFSDNPHFTARFLEEGRLLASLRHNNIMTIYDIGVCDNLHYISMEYVDGGDLKERIRNGISPRTALDYTITIASCLQVAHASRIIHRDVKPVNILFRNDDTLLLTDFGIAKQLVGRKNITVTGSLVGSPYYLSPEQALGGDVDGRADIYSLGIVLFEMLMGKRPFDGDSQIDVALKHIEGHLPPLPPTLSHFQPLLNKMTSKQTHDRFRDAASMLHAAQHLRDSHLLWDSNSPVTLTSPPTYPGFDDTTVYYLADSQADLHDNAFAPDKTTTSTNQSKAQEPLPADGQKTSSSTALKTEKESKRTAKTTGWGLRKMGGVAAGLCALALFTSLLTIGLPDVSMITPRLEIKTDKTSPTTTQNNQENVFVEASSVKPHTLIEYSPPSELIRQTPQVEPLKPINDAKPPQLAKFKEKDRLLNAAQEALSEYRLTRPAGNNAYDYYQEVLRLEPSNRQANDGLIQIADRYHHLARTALSKGQKEKAERYTTSGLKVKKAHPALLALKDELSAQSSHDHDVMHREERGHPRTSQYESTLPKEEVESSKGIRIQNNQIGDDLDSQQQDSDNEG